MIARLTGILHGVHGREDGAAFVELALALPLLALLLIGIIEVGRYLALAVRLSNAAHAGAQFAVSQFPTNAFNRAQIANAACGDSGFTCTGSKPNPRATMAPDTMFVTSSVRCTYSNGTSNNTCPPPPDGVQRVVLVNVSTSGTFLPLFNYPIMPQTVSMSATATLPVGQ